MWYLLIKLAFFWWSKIQIIGIYITFLLCRMHCISTHVCESVSVCMCSEARDYQVFFSITFLPILLKQHVSLSVGLAVSPALAAHQSQDSHVSNDTVMVLRPCTQVARLRFCSTWALDIQIRSSWFVTPALAFWASHPVLHSIS